MTTVEADNQISAAEFDQDPIPATTIAEYSRRFGVSTSDALQEIANGVTFSDVPGTNYGMVVVRRMDAIKPSANNDLLYRPIDPEDPSIQALAESIEERGLKEPIIITLDDVIISGHRRYAAHKVLGRQTIKCRVEPILSTSDEFLVLLRECNRQRVKSFDEIVREELLTVDPEDSHRVLVEHRRQTARISVQTIAIVGTKRRAAISKAKLPFLQAIQAIIEDREEFWPLTDRSIHYALLNAPPLIHASKPQSRYANNLKFYKATCELLTRARLRGLISHEAIGDDTRPVTEWNVHHEAATFVRQALEGLLKGYYRDLLQSQPNHVEVLGEKNTIESIIRPVCAEFTLTYTIGRGYASLPPRKAMFDRFKKSGKERLVLLAIFDCDPEGEDAPHSFARSMRDDFGLENVDCVKVALTKAQVDAMQLPPKIEAKTKSSRYEKFLKHNGKFAYELEAIPPQRLQQELRGCITQILDLEAFANEQRHEKEESAQMLAFRRSLQKQIGQWNGFGQP